MNNDTDINIHFEYRNSFGKLAEPNVTTILNKPRKYNVVLINEGQFFPDIKHTVINLVDKYKKQVYICGLDGDFQRSKFGDLIDLIPYCNKISKLTSLCALCKNGTHGIFTHRLTNDKKQIMIGSDSYIPLCRSCYLENVKTN